ncbi:MAG: phosphonopyruvate decarboxylase [Gammaproteobacteria bacterium]
MIAADLFVERARSAGFRLYAGVPCSFLKPFINYAINDSRLQYVAAANEGDAVAIAAGAELAGTRAVAMFQNSGLGNAVNPLTSLTHTARIPVLLIVTLRGDPDGDRDEPQHELMGRITGDLLNLMDIPWEYFPDSEDQVAPVLERVDRHMSNEGRPYALVMRKGSVEPHRLESLPQQFSWQQDASQPMIGRHSRRDVLAAVVASARADDILIATTGYTGRELFNVADRPANFYMVGSMGCASSLGLGIALVKPDRRVIVLDGDGALVMRLGALTAIGACRPPNLMHFVLDNGMHESTGGQATAAGGSDFCAMAAACGYTSIHAIDDPEKIAPLMSSTMSGPSFIRAAICPGVPADLPRPDIMPADVAKRLRSALEAPGGA